MTVSITRSEHRPSDLRREAARTADSRAARRMLALALVMEGESRETAARQCGMDRQESGSTSNKTTLAIASSKPTTISSTPAVRPGTRLWLCRTASPLSAPANGRERSRHRPADITADVDVALPYGLDGSRATRGVLHESPPATRAYQHCRRETIRQNTGL
jgi:hypothetical protein